MSDITYYLKDVTKHDGPSKQNENDMKKALLKLMKMEENKKATRDLVSELGKILLCTIQKLNLRNN